MSKKLLLQTAVLLQQPSKESCIEYSEKLNSLVERINSTMVKRQDITEMVGEDNLEMMKDNHANHARFMESIFENYIPEVLVDTVLWVFKAYRSRNFSSTYWAAQLNTWMGIYSEELSKECQSEIFPFYKWMQVNIPIFNSLAEQDIDTPLSTH